MNSLMEKLNRKAREQEYATTWKPVPGEILEATYERTQTVETRFGEQQVSQIRDAEGKLWGVWHSHKVFRQQWHQADPQPGDRVGILYEGMREGDGYEYHMYHIAVERAEDAAERRAEGGEESTAHRRAGDSAERSEDGPERSAQPKTSPDRSTRQNQREGAQQSLRPRKGEGAGAGDADASSKLNPDGSFNWDEITDLPY